MMNIFRGSGDIAHAIGILWLLKMAMRGNASGISLKAQELYLVVFLARYLDLFTTFYSPYNSFMKIFYILATATIIFCLRHDATKSSYSPTHDSFQHWKLLSLPCAILAVLISIAGAYRYHHRVMQMHPEEPLVGNNDHNLLGLYYLVMELSFMEMFWTFSILLESVAMLPQLIMFRSDRFVKGNTGEKRDEILYPIFLFGIYRALYIVNWIYRANTERNYRHHYLVYICGCVQVLLYTQFFRICCKASLCPEAGKSDHNIDDEGTEEDDPEATYGLLEDTSDSNSNNDISDKKQDEPTSGPEEEDKGGEADPKASTPLLDDAAAADNASSGAQVVRV